MRKIVVASHSLLAQGFKDTLEFLTGKGDAVNAVCAYVNDNGEGLDAAILMHPTVWKASGHVDGFSDPLCDCKKCKFTLCKELLKEINI